MISALIPACNESERLADTLAGLRAGGILGADGEIVVVDDGSTDDTAARAEAAGADVIFRQANAGKGAALRQALQLSQGDVILLLDADLGRSAGEARLLLAPLLANEADMTIAAFPQRAGKGGGVGLVVRLARWGIFRLTGRVMVSPLSGQRAVRREVLTQVGGFAEGWSVEIALTVTALRAGFRVLEVPTTMTHRVTGRDFGAIRHRAAQFIAALRVLFRLWRDAPRPPSRRQN